MEMIIIDADSQLRQSLIGPGAETQAQKTPESGSPVKTGISIKDLNDHGYLDIALGVLIGLSGVLLIIGQIKKHFMRFALVPIIIVSILWILSSINSFISGSTMIGVSHHPLLLLPVLPAIILAGISVMNYISNTKCKDPDDL